MKFALLFLVTFLSTFALAHEEQMEASYWQYSCTVTDANYGHYWGASNHSQADAYSRAMNDCYRHSMDAGTCALVSCR